MNRRAPHGTIYALEGLEVALIGAAFDQDISMVFMDDGVFQLIKGQDPKVLGMKNFSVTFKALGMYGIEQIYVETASMHKRGLSKNDLIVPVKEVAGFDLTDLMEQQDVLLNF